MQQKIFVTGGTGFLGSYLLRYLVEKGYSNIRAIRRATSAMDLVEEVKNKIEWVEGDILDIPFLEEMMEGMEEVYHCAAMVSFDPRDAAQMLEINEMGTANVVNISLLHGIKKLVHISSIAAIGKEQFGAAISEKTKWKNDKKNSNYAKSKYAAEMQVWRGIAEGLNAAIVNPSVILGSGFWNKGTCKIFELYGNGFPFYSSGVNGFIDVRDVAKFIALLMESDIVEERFLLNAENIPYQDVFNSIAKKANAKLPFIKINSLLTAIGWRLEWLRSKITGHTPTVTKETTRNAAQQNYYDNKKSISAFGFKYTPIEQTIEETIRQFIEAKQTGKKGSFLPL